MSSDAGRPRFNTPVQQPWFAIPSRVQRALAGVAAGAFVFLSGGILDWFVTRQYLPRVSLMLAGAAVALAAGISIFRILTDIQRRYQAMQDRLQRIAELNHHIRNALQVIAYHNVPERGERAIQQVNAEVMRIQSVLRDVSTALGEHADLPAAIITAKRRKP
jgi:type II secretory pathway component PulM